MSTAAALSACFEYLTGRALLSLPLKAGKTEKLSRQFLDEPNRQTLEEFIREPEVRSCYIFMEGAERVVCSLRPEMRRKGVFLLKSRRVQDALRVDELRADVCFCECTENILNNLSLVSHEVFFPLLSNPANRAGWSGPTAKDVMMRVSGFLSSVTIAVGQSRGQTLLPLPPPEAFDEEALQEKERVHVLETAVIQWSSRVEAVINSDSDALLRQNAALALQAEKDAAADKRRKAGSGAASGAAAAEEGNAADKKGEEASEAMKAEKAAEANAEKEKANALHFPGPQFELEFWANKQADLSSLSQQLASPRLQQVHSILQHFSSQYAEQLLQLQASVAARQAECESNNRFLRPLRPYFLQLSEELDFTRLEAAFHPLFHTLLLIFKHSPHYNTSGRLSCLLQMIGNALITQANKHVNGDGCFRLIEDENTAEAAALIRQTVRSCQRFKAVFRLYQQKAAQAFTDPTCATFRSWDVDDAQLFGRLDAYLERAEDMMDFCRIVVDFSKLQRIHIGGTKGKELTAALWQIHTDFIAQMQRFKRVDYDLLDISVSAFDTDYYHYKAGVKELEKRLAAVLMTAFSDCATLSARFQLLDSFEGLLERPIVKDELDKRLTQLLALYTDDLRAVHALFLTGRQTPKIEMNMPPVAGALSWVRALKSRVEEPMEKLRYYVHFLSSGVADGSSGSEQAEREELREIYKIQTALVQQLTEYEQRALGDWSVEIAATSDGKLQQNLLRRDPNTQLLYVNFDAGLVKLLREVKYFLLLKIDVPQTALRIYDKAELYRQQIAHLEYILSMYNEMISSLHAVERPLVARDIAAIDAVLERGIRQLNWKDEEVNSFINECVAIVKQAYSTVKLMKENLASIRRMMQEFASVPLAERKNKPLSPADFEDNLRKLWQQRHTLLVESGEQVNRLLEETKRQLQGDQQPPQVWAAYVDYVQDGVRDGLAAAIVTSLKFLCEQLDAAKPDLSPMLEVKLGLYQGDVAFNAEDSQGSGVHSSRGSVSSNAGDGSGQQLLQPTLQPSASLLPGDGAVDLSSSSSASALARRGRHDVWLLVSEWVDQFFEIGRLITRQDGSTYVADLRRNEQIARYSALLNRHLEHNSRMCEEVRADYCKYEFLWKTDRQAEFHRFLQSGLAEQKAKAAEEERKGGKAGGEGDKKEAGAEAGGSGAEAGEEEDGSAESGEYELLPLDRFEEQILRYRDIAAEIGERKSPIEIGWLKVNAQPVKVALQSWANRWVLAFTQFLHNDVTRKLHALETLMAEVNEGLTTEVAAGDSVTLKRVLGFIHSIRSAEKSTLKLFQPLRDTVSLLKKYGRSLDESELKLLSDAPMKWDSTVNNVYKVKEKVNNMQNDEVDKIKEKVEAFDTELRSMRREYRENAPFAYDIAVNEAYDLIAEYHDALNVLEERAARLIDLERVFELSVSKHRQIRKCRAENRLLKWVWDMCSVIKHQYEDWKKTRWNSIDTDELLAETKKLQRSLMQLPSEVQGWDVYQGLQSEVKKLLTVLPLVNLLHSPAMEDRHWRELKVATGKSFLKDDSFCLSNVLELELHKFVSDVEYIVELANKESKISQQLRKIESQWLTLELQFGTAANGVTSIKRPDDILVALEENMAALQGMSGQGKYVEHFIEQVTKWQKLLNHAETVLYDWLDVQAKWSSLEAIFLGSRDIRVQLPEDSRRFDEIDAEWKQLMANAQHTPNVIEACSAHSRSEKLTSMKHGLGLCEKSLFQYLETKRKAFPRFYFLSNAALLDILSSGHDPQAVQKHLGDCFPEDDTRVLTDSGFLFLKQIEARILAKETVLYACYDIAKQSLVYSPGELVLRPNPARWVDFTQAFTRPLWDATSDEYGSTVARVGKIANYISIRTTPQHKMYVQLAPSVVGPPRKRGGVPVPHHKMPAAELAPGFACQCRPGVKCTHGYPVYRLLTGAPDGIACAGVMSKWDTAELLAHRPPGERDSPVVRLGLHESDQLDAFLSLYGYWVGDGTMQYIPSTKRPYAVALKPKKLRDRPYVLDLIRRLRLTPGEWTVDDGHVDGCLKILITAERWCLYFDEQYGPKYEDSLHSNPDVAVAKLGNGPAFVSAARRASASARLEGGARRASLSDSSSSSSLRIDARPVSFSDSSSSLRSDATALTRRSPVHDCACAVCGDLSSALQYSRRDDSDQCANCIAAAAEDGSVCCECGDDSSSDANLLLRCTGTDGEGQRCTRAVHLLCCTLIKVPAGGWRCEYHEPGEPTGKPFDPDEEKPAKSCKWWWWWVLKRLDKRQLRLVIEGLRQADGVSARSKKQKAAGTEFSGLRRIATSSVSFRDALIQACLHAGYSAYFIVNTRAGVVRGYNAVPNDYRIYSEAEMKQLLARDSKRRFEAVCPKYDNWWVKYSLSTEVKLPAADVRYDGKPLRPRRNRQRPASKGYVATHARFGLRSASTMTALGDAIGVSTKTVSNYADKKKRTPAGWQVFTKAAYEASTSSSTSSSSRRAASPEATAPADQYSEQDGRTWCVHVTHKDHLIVVQRAHRNAHDIVTKATRPVVIGNCFDNIARLSFAAKDDGSTPSKTATGMHSKEGDEYVPLAQDFECVGAVEDWLNRLVTAMRSTLMDVLSKAKFTADHWEIEKPRHRWLFDYPAQLALTASQIIWTEEVNSQFDAFADGNEQAMKEYASKVLAARLEQLIQLVLGELTHCDRTKIMTLITVDVHNRDVVQKLIDNKVQDASAFAWQSQMRMRWKADSKDCSIQVADAAFNYSYEYVGNTGRLVITPLTDRCYITLTQALRLIMGGAPAGPAGTGKTETTKDLGRAMGLPVYVFNCSEQMNVQSLGTVFKGLAQTGAWGCFDEFNRIPIEVLSVVSTQVSCILNGVREKRSEFDFMGEVIKLVPSVGMFITMNPGYAGRTELPENLKALFRSCAMVVPDMNLICENMLMSEGFMQAQRLAKKFTTLYSLSSELLSKQRHYDWGLRATKAVLRIAGGMKRAEPKVDEDRILMRALRDSNLAKLVDDDKPIFRELINDLFPGLGGTERKVDLKLQEAIATVAQQRGLQAEETFVFKCLELAELLAIRHSVFVVGPAGCGKSEVWKTLYAAYKAVGKRSAYEVINPKAIRNNELYGWLSKTDWHDGVLSTVMRNMSRNRPPYTEDQLAKWVVLDGDIDPNWIESLNCFPADDHELLTAAGFMTLQQVQQHFAQQPTLQVACYVNNHLEYHHITADKLTIKTGHHELVDMRSQGFLSSGDNRRGLVNGVDISPTRNHRMFGVCRPTRQPSSGQRQWTHEATQPVRWATHTAGAIFAAGQKDESVVFQLQAGARDGLQPDDDDWRSLPFVEPLALQSLDEAAAFVELYGCWLGNGSLLSADRAVSFSPVKGQDELYLDGLFARLPSIPLLQGESGSGNTSGGQGYHKQRRNKQSAYSITHRTWWDWFAQQYGHRYAGHWCRVAALEGALRRNSDVPAGRSGKQQALPRAEVETELRRLLLQGPPHMLADARASTAQQAQAGRTCRRHVDVPRQTAVTADRDDEGEDAEVDDGEDDERRDDGAAQSLAADDAVDETAVKDEKWDNLGLPDGWKSIPLEHLQPEEDVEEQRDEDDSEADSATEVESDDDSRQSDTENKAVFAASSLSSLSASCPLTRLSSPLAGSKKRPAGKPSDTTRSRVKVCRSRVQDAEQQRVQEPGDKAGAAAPRAAYYCPYQVGAVSAENIDQVISAIKAARVVEPQPPDAEDIDSVKWAAHWARLQLGSSLCRLLIAGIRFADGTQKALKQQRSGDLLKQSNNRIHTSSARFKEELVQLLLHAGFSVRSGVEAEPGQTGGVNVDGAAMTARHHDFYVEYASFSEAEAARPRLLVKRETRARLWTGTVWCITVPTPGQRIVFRRVTRRECGLVLEASRPVVVGNTVMDDNKMLTLVSNERIPLSPSMRMMFEISNLDNATPATVSRAGILFINAKDIGSKPFLDSWIERRESDKEKSSLLALFNKYCTPEYLHEMLTSYARIIPVSEVTIIRTLCYLLEGLLARLAEQRKARLKADEKLEPAVEKEQFEANFVFAVIWAFGGAALVDKSVDTRKEFSDFFKRVFTTIKFPKEGHVFDYYPDSRTGKMVPWSEIVPAFHPPDDAYLVTKVFVPTVDTVSLTFVLDLLVQRQKPVLLVGTAGTGKTVLCNHFLHSMGESMLFCNINLNYYTDAKSLQSQLEGHVDKRSGRIYGPPTSKRLVYFIDDLNMPAVDAYGTQSPSALIKQHMDYGGWYDVSKLEKKEIQDVQYIACMNPTAGSFTVDPRLQGLFATFACLLPSKKNLTHIYSTVLSHHFQSFSPAVLDCIPRLIRATIELHDNVSLKFIPSTKKFHYLFNLRDLSNVFQGLCLAQQGESFTAKMIVQLWYHECTRVFSDRLVSPEDCALFSELLDGKLKSEFKEVGELRKDGADDVVFTSFMSSGSPAYLPCENMAALKSTLESRLAAYNEENAIMNLELFSLAISHISRIARIIENPRGNALLVGVGGSGKQSLAKLASSICGYDVFQITVSQSYGLNDLRADLQGMYMKAGVKGLPLTWLLTDTQIVDDTWLVYVNDLLSSGNIADLFSTEDKDAIINSVRNEARQRGIADTREAMYEYFISQVRTNLHVVLCFSPVGELFRIRCRKFPGLISCTTIDWFHPWPRDALISVANRFLQEVEIVNAEAGKIKGAVAEHMAEVHLSVNVASAAYAATERRHNYTTPKSFLELIAFYKRLLGKKRDELRKGQSRLEKGIATLKQTHAQVADLKKDLQETLVKVKEKSEAASVLISKMGVERKKVEEQQSVAAVEAEKAKAVSEVAGKISADCKKDLDAAYPILEKAKEAVACLSKASLTTLKSFASPPGNVLFVTNAVLILKNIPGKKDWAAAKKMMKDVGKFLDELKAFDATNIGADIIDKLQPILREEWFNEESMKSSSEAAANLCAWVVNTVAYNQVYKNVAPKMAAQATATDELNDAQAKLKQVEDRVAAMQSKLASVTGSLKEATDEKNKVEAEAANCQQRLELANRLVDGLADENTRWGRSILQFEEKGRTLVGDTMLAAAFVSYIGAFNQKFRLGLWKDQWLPDLISRAIPLTDGVDPLSVLATDSDFAKWKNEGLAADRISLENGAIVTQCSRWPLMIDPQLQGVKWIKGRVKGLKLIQLSQKRWMNTILTAITMGDAVLIEGVGEELDATLDPLLSRSIFQRGSQKMIKLGTEEVSYDDGFHLYIQTKLFNPHYRPEIFAQCTLINFIVTEEGLEEQLLALVVNKEKPELEEKRTALVRAINDYMVSLTDLENELLERLSNAPDDILSDVALIEGLEKTKQASTEIEQKVELAKKQEVSINAARNEFRQVAAESSWLYFLLIQLCSIDHMYQYSLDAFIGFFLKAMTRARKAELTRDRVVALRESIRITVFTWVNRGLFEKHKLIFSSQLAFKLMQKAALQESFDATNYDFLIRGPKKLGVDKTIQLDWLPFPAWAAIQRLIELPGFERLAADMQASPNRFKEWYNKPRPEDTPLPLEWRKLDDSGPFMKLLVVRAMRPDRMTVAMENYVRLSLPNGKDFTECDAGKSFLDVLTLSLDDATPVNPIFFILSAGADPVHSVEVIAKRAGYYDSKFHRVALGEGQDVVAMSRLETGHREGHWIVLENIHLMPRWNAELEKKLDDFAAEGSHPDFRVFLSAEPSSAMPIGILERSIKLTNEPPQGLKANLKRAFASFEKEEFEFKDGKVKSILFGLCIAEGTPISMGDGTSTAIQSVLPGDKVLTMSPDAPGVLAASNLHTVAKGAKACVELLFSDGRTLRCTPDHKIRTADGLWVAAKDLVVAHAAVNVATKRTVTVTPGSDVSVTVRYPVAQWADRDAPWQLACGAEFGVNGGARRSHAVAFSRMIGYVLADGSVHEQQTQVYLGHQLDVDAFLADVQLLAGVQPAVTPHRGLYIVRLPGILHRALRSAAVGLATGNRREQLTPFPAFVLADNCPIPVVRAFLSGLYGGDGHAPVLAQWDEASGSHFEAPCFSRTKSGRVAKQQAQQFTDELEALLSKVGLDRQHFRCSAFLVKAHNLTAKGRAQVRALKRDSAKLSEAVDVVNAQLRPTASYRLRFCIGEANVTAFAAAVSYAYCCHKQVRLEAARIYYDGKAFIMSQREELRAAISQLLKGGVNPGTGPTGPGHAVHRDARELPLLRVQLVGRKEIAACPVYDLEVTTGESFVANGVVVHNCHFHSVMIERIKFGPKGWNKSYPFSTGDLMCSNQVLANYLESGSASDRVPWSDLRYIFGEILYGGHITDDWDRLLCSTYLEFYMREELLDEMEMYPFNELYAEERFRSPPVLPYDQYFDYIDHEMRPENPVAFGLHPNAEIAVKTRQCNELFTAILDLQPRTGGGGSADAATSPQALVQLLIATVLTDKSRGIEGINFNLEDIASALVDERGPYQNVFLQECDRMNALCREMRRSLRELDLGLSGELQMSERMETLFQALYLGRVPASWAKLAYPSQRSLSSWMDNLVLRAQQLQGWTEEPVSIPVVTQISYLFNPQSFLTAIMQKTAQKQKMELDKLVIQTDVTRKTVEQTDTRARDGAYVYGLYMEGARWNWNAGVMEECLPREMSCALPVVVCRAVLADKLEKSGVYRCPCYKTQRRGDTFVFTANLRTKAPAAKWILAGAVLVMEVEE